MLMLEEHSWQQHRLLIEERQILACALYDISCLTEHKVQQSSSARQLSINNPGLRVGGCLHVVTHITLCPHA